MSASSPSSPWSSDDVLEGNLWSCSSFVSQTTKEESEVPSPFRRLQFFEQLHEDVESGHVVEAVAKLLEEPLVLPIEEKCDQLVTAKPTLRITYFAVNVDAFKPLDAFKPRKLAEWSSLEKISCCGLIMHKRCVQEQFSGANASKECLFCRATKFRYQKIRSTDKKLQRMRCPFTNCSHQLYSKYSGSKKR